MDNSKKSPGNANLPIGGVDNAKLGEVDPAKLGDANAAATEFSGEKNANREIGAPGWHSRGYLPHFESSDVTQHVTFHLADSLPQTTLLRLESELKFLSAEKRATERRKQAWRDRFAAVPFEDKGGYFQGRYYQDLAIERVMEAIAADQSRILLTLATGTGKTFIAFQIAWKLFHSRWNLSREPSRRPRILFLADRNILADQAYNAFSPFPEDALQRIEPDEIRKKGKVPKNASLFFTIFQTFMSGPGNATSAPSRG